MIPVLAILTNLYREYNTDASPYGVSRQYSNKKKQTKTTIKLYPILHDHYTWQINDISRLNGKYSANFKLVNTADYTYFGYLQPHSYWKSLENPPKLKVIFQIVCMLLRLQDCVTFILKYIKFIMFIVLLMTPHEMHWT